MNYKRHSQAVLIVVALAGVCGPAVMAEEIHWADDVAVWTGTIQNYGLYGAAEEMTTETSWWLTGPPDADDTEDGQHGEGDSDTVAGWRLSFAADFTLHFDTCLTDQPGDDLLVVGYGSSTGQFSVHASSDGNVFVPIGTANGIGPRNFTDYWFDYAGLVNDVRYVKILREVSGSQTGMFFDAIGGYAIPEPNAIGLLASGVFCAAACLVVRRARRKASNHPRNQWSD
jgi:hypothetical protein